MAIAAYGTNIPINISNSDITSLVDISYCYHENRTYDSLSNATFYPLESTILTQAQRDSDSGVDQVVEGMYNLQLPVSVFNRKGFYTVYIKPKEIAATIADVGTLTAYPDIRGLVIDISTIDNDNIQTKAQNSNELAGYRIIYLDDSGNRQDHYRIITSNNRCEPVIQAPNSSSDKSYTYRYEESSNLIFVTVTPSSAPSFKTNATPYIGKPTQRILLVNTLFEPIMLDIEMTTHDADTISYMLENSQLRDLDHGLVTTYDENGNIYIQHEYYTMKDQYTGKPIYEVKENRDSNIDFSQSSTLFQS